eukprot:TRINITY_DN65453_c0_g1_i1.p1 TRINITY_DN65453_c0_g1~~TRINITY_DN65453_c0_g1_i1.p1  ORF type:complete len:1341 (+),score=294.59 TRINITY_DN65453_c0_g1_i1:84-4025(+)
MPLGGASGGSSPLSHALGGFPGGSETPARATTATRSQHSMGSSASARWASVARGMSAARSGCVTPARKVTLPASEGGDDYPSPRDNTQRRSSALKTLSILQAAVHRVSRVCRVISVVSQGDDDGSGSQPGSAHGSRSFPSASIDGTSLSGGARRGLGAKAELLLRPAEIHTAQRQRISLAASSVPTAAAVIGSERASVAAALIAVAQEAVLRSGGRSGSMKFQYDLASFMLMYGDIDSPSLEIEVEPASTTLGIHRTPEFDQTAPVGYTHNNLPPNDQTQADTPGLFPRQETEAVSAITSAKPNTTSPPSLLTSALLSPNSQERMKDELWQSVRLLPAAASSRSTGRLIPRSRMGTSMRGSVAVALRSPKLFWARIRDAVRLPRRLLGGGGKRVVELFNMCTAQQDVTATPLMPLETKLLRQYGLMLQRRAAAQMKQVHQEVARLQRRIKHLEEQHADTLRQAARNAAAARYEGGPPRRVGTCVTGGHAAQDDSAQVEQLKAQIKLQSEMLKSGRLQMQVALQRLGGDKTGAERDKHIVRALFLKLQGMQGELQEAIRQFKEGKENIRSFMDSCLRDLCIMIESTPAAPIGPKQARDIAVDARKLQTSLCGLAPMLDTIGVNVAPISELSILEIEESLQGDAEFGVPPYAEQYFTAAQAIRAAMPCLTELAALWTDWWIGQRMEFDRLHSSERELVNVADAYLQELLDTQRELDSTKVELAECKAKIIKLEAELRTAWKIAAKVAPLEAELAETQDQLAAARVAQAEAERKLKMAVEREAATARALAQEERAHTECRSALDKACSEIVELANAKVRLQAEVESLSGERKNLRDQVAELSGALQAAAGAAAEEQGVEVLGNAMVTALSRKLGVVEMMLGESEKKQADMSERLLQRGLELDRTKAVLEDTQRELHGRMAEAIQRREKAWTHFQDRVGWLLAPTGLERSTTRQQLKLLTELHQVDGEQFASLAKVEHELVQCRLQLGEAGRIAADREADASREKQAADEARAAQEKYKRRLEKATMLIERQRQRIEQLNRRLVDVRSHRGEVGSSYGGTLGGPQTSAVPGLLTSMNSDWGPVSADEALPGSAEAVPPAGSRLPSPIPSPRPPDSQMLDLDSPFTEMSPPLKLLPRSRQQLGDPSQPPAASQLAPGPVVPAGPCPPHPPLPHDRRPYTARLAALPAAPGAAPSTARLAAVVSERRAPPVVTGVIALSPQQPDAASPAGISPAQAPTAGGPAQGAVSAVSLGEEDRGVLRPLATPGRPGYALPARPPPRRARSAPHHRRWQYSYVVPGSPRGGGSGDEEEQQPMRGAP